MKFQRGLLVCANCYKEVTEGEANVMVNDHKLRTEHLIANLRLVCKTCTRKLDQAAGGRSNEHAIWELRVLRQHPWWYLGKVLAENARADERRDSWTPESVDAFVEILIELLPSEDAAGLLQYYFAPTEWNGDGPRTERFHNNRNIPPDERPDPV